jgi:uncharacterized protein YbjQ (UPF0145 family)
VSELQAAMAALGSPDRSSPAGAPRGATSDLSIDETLLLHSIGYEPVDLVFGVSWWSIPWGVWQWQTGEISEASEAFAGAMQDASDDLRAECSAAGGTGVVGVGVELRVTSHHVDIALTGTAVRPVGSKGDGVQFISDLSARDFALLTRAGWTPVGLVAGASFVVAPRRSARQWAAQQSQNVELPNLTEALYLAREGAMARMQEAGRSLDADGVVQVKLREGPMGRGSRATQFMAVGTAVRETEGGHRFISPSMVVPLDDLVRQFEVKSLRAAPRASRNAPLT